MYPGDTTDQHRFGYLATPALLLLTLAMVILRIPPFLLDTLFTFNIAFSLLMLLLAIQIDRPLNFSVFPSLLLIATLLRLALNVASTRVVLLQGHTGTDAAGRVIEAFGTVVIAGNYVVGFVIFTILVIVNFVVITKGCTRISEVTARFTLDAMPGKQMAIDADLNAGILNQQEAGERREAVSREADFYGAMDGASKFVRGDAVASLLILAINIIGGIAIGLFQYDLPLATAFHTYGLLTIGDGLVAQVPSLLLSTTAAIMVTRVSGSGNMPARIRQELFSSPRAFLVCASILIIMGLVPGMPHLAFAGLGLLVALPGLKSLRRTKTERETSSTETGGETPDTAESPLDWRELHPADPLGLEIGYRLIPLVDSRNKSELTSSIRGVRKNLSQKLGFLIPSVHIRDNLDLDPDHYVITLHGVQFATGRVIPDHVLAIATRESNGELAGTPDHDPCYGLDAVWITRDQEEQAVRQGYTVVDGPTIIATHLGQIMEDHAHELFGYDEAQDWLEQLRQLSPRLADELIPDKLSLGQLMRICQALLIEQVPLTDMRTIAATLIDTSSKDRQPLMMAQEVRVALRRMILNSLAGMDNALPVTTLSPALEKLLLEAWRQANQNGGFSPDAIPLEPSLTAQLQKNLPTVEQQMENQGQVPVLLAVPQLRPLLARFAHVCTKHLRVLSFSEIPDDRQVNIIGHIG